MRITFLPLALAGAALLAAPTLGQPLPQHDALYQQARQLREAGDYAKCVRTLDRLIQQLPLAMPFDQLYAAQALILRGSTLGVEQRHGDAISDMDAALKLLKQADRFAGIPQQDKRTTYQLNSYQKKTDAIALKGEYLLRLSEYYDAEDCLNEALSLTDPNDLNSNCREIMQKAGGSIRTKIAEMGIRSRIAMAELAELIGGRNRMRVRTAEADAYLNGVAAQHIPPALVPLWQGRIDFLRGRLLSVSGQHLAAADEFRNALDRSRQFREKDLVSFGSLDLPTQILNLGSELLFAGRDQHDQAGQLLAEAVAGFEKSGRSRIDFSYALMYQGILAMDRGDFEEADKHFRTSGAIHDQLELRADHPNRVALLNWEGERYAKAGDWGRAAEKLTDARQRARRHIETVIAYRPEPIQREFLLNKDRDEWFCTAMSAAIDGRAEPGVAAAAMEWCINGKGMLLPVMAERFKAARGNEALLSNLRAGINGVTLASFYEKPADNGDDLLRRYDRARETLAKEARKQANKARAAVQPLRWFNSEQVQARLQADEALIEVVRFQKRTLGDLANRSGTPMYAAWVVTDSAAPTLVPLGRADRIDAAVATAAALMEPGQYKDQRDELQLPLIQKQDAAVNRAFSELHRLVTAPLMASAGPKARWTVSPDGDLWRVPWAAFRAGNEFLCQSHAIGYVFSGRELAERRRGTRAADAASVFGSVAYQTSEGSLLPQTELQDSQVIQTVTTELKKTHRVDRRLGSAATEQQLRRDLAEGRAVLHLNTHGFSRPDRSGLPGESVDPFLCCGVTLANVGRRTPSSREAENDGVLFGTDILTLDLGTNSLLVLSACETGKGAVSSAGEGVQSLQYAFRLAGVRQVVSTLFEVPEKTNNPLQEAFYRELGKGRDAVASLQAAQTEIVRTCDDEFGTTHPFLWASTVVNGRVRD